MEPFIGTIMPVGFSYAPKGWALCNGQTMAIQQNQALFSLIGTYFGGNGTTTFALPDLRGRTPSSLTGQVGTPSGTENVSLQLSQIPSHSHALNATSATAPASRGALPTGNIFSAPNAKTQSIFGSQSNAVLLAANNVGLIGSGVPHNNMQPYLVLNYVIALTGIFPSRS